MSIQFSEFKSLHLVKCRPGKKPYFFLAAFLFALIIFAPLSAEDPIPNLEEFHKVKNFQVEFIEGEIQTRLNGVFENRGAGVAVSSILVEIRGAWNTTYHPDYAIGPIHVTLHYSSTGIHLIQETRFGVHVLSIYYNWNEEQQGYYAILSTHFSFLNGEAMNQTYQGYAKVVLDKKEK